MISTLEKKYILMIKLLLSVSLVKTVDSSFVDQYGGCGFFTYQIFTAASPSLSISNIGHKAGQWSGGVVSEDLQ